MKIQIDVDSVQEKQNRKWMLGAEEIASGTFGGGDKPFKVLQSDNRNVITIIVDGYYHHVLVNDIILEVLKQNLSVSLTKEESAIHQN